VWHAVSAAEQLLKRCAATRVCLAGLVHSASTVLCPVSAEGAEVASAVWSAQVNVLIGMRVWQVVAQRFIMLDCCAVRSLNARRQRKWQ
jgi:hypothetical protein